MAEPQKTPLLMLALQGEAQVALIQVLLETGAGTVFDVTHEGRPLKDSDLGLPPGTLGRDMAAALGNPPEIFADVPQLVTLLTFNEKQEPASCAERIQRIVQLTALGRQAAASPATHMLILHPIDRTVPPAEFLRMSEPRPEAPAAELMVWLDLVGVDGNVATTGLNTFGLPEVTLSLVRDASEAVAKDGIEALFTVAQNMLERKGPLKDGTTVGHPGSTTYETRADGGLIRLDALHPKKPSLWKRVFH